MSSRGAALGIDLTGRAVIAGWANQGSGRDVMLVRLTPDSAPDPSFGVSRVVLLQAPADPQAVAAIAIQPDGRILVAAATTEGGSADFLLVRLAPSCALDQGLGTGGRAVVVVGGDDHPVSMALLLEGHVVMGGNGAAGPELARFPAQRRPRPHTFGEAGAASIFLGSEGVVPSIARAAKGKLLLAGTQAGSPYKGFVARVWN